MGIAVDPNSTIRSSYRAHSTTDWIHGVTMQPHQPPIPIKKQKVMWSTDNPQVQGITVAPVNVEVWVSIRRSKKEKLLLSPTRVS
jgi:hypothetical protein